MWVEVRWSPRESSVQRENTLSDRRKMILNMYGASCYLDVGKADSMHIPTCPVNSDIESLLLCFPVTYQETAVS